jgi:hypothetical protein
LTAKKQPKKQKDGLVYPTAEDVVRINRAVLGKLPPEEMAKLPESTRKQIERMAKQFKPRPKERIPEILDALKELWLLEPDQRLGQLLENYVFLDGSRGKDQTSVALYAQEDTETLKNLQKIIKERVTDEKQSK